LQNIHLIRDQSPKNIINPNNSIARKQITYLEKRAKDLNISEKTYKWTTDV
jgi:uncharacterized protein YllA (UPF0747 family)